MASHIFRSRALTPAIRALSTAHQSCAQPAADYIRSVLPEKFSPTLGLVLGSGMGGVADRLEDPTTIPYADIPGFPVSTVSGHAGQLVCGTLNGAAVACFQGRVHLYEGIDPMTLRVPTYALKLIGCESLLLTTAVGSMRQEVGPGSIVLVSDHINLQARNPLIGPNDPIGDRFPSLMDAYDPELRRQLQDCGRALDPPIEDIPEGVYCASLGPSFETPAEIRAFKMMGADWAGMSTVAEVVLARHCGLRVAAVGVVVNLASGMSDTHITHDETLHFTGLAADNVSRLVGEFASRQ
jgi:xanthosine phosphorylase